MPLLSTDPVDLMLDSSGDLVIQNGDLQLVQAGDDGAGHCGVAQLVQIACGLVRGEWFLDLDAGVPYFERDGVPASDAIMGQQFDPAKAQADFREAILSVAGVGEVVSLTADFDAKSRTLTVTWTIRTAFGDTVTDTLAKEM